MRCHSLLDPVSVAVELIARQSDNFRVPGLEILRPPRDLSQFGRADGSEIANETKQPLISLLNDGGHQGRREAILTQGERRR